MRNISIMNHFGLINEFSKWRNAHFLAARYNATPPKGDRAEAVRRDHPILFYRVDSPMLAFDCLSGAAWFRLSVFGVAVGVGSLCGRGGFAVVISCPGASYIDHSDKLTTI